MALKRSTALAVDGILRGAGLRPSLPRNQNRGVSRAALRAAARSCRAEAPRRGGGFWSMDKSSLSREADFVRSFINELTTLAQGALGFAYAHQVLLASEGL